MPVRCGKCNEELLGAVNRCWKCGTKVILAADAPSLPPIRRSRIEGSLYSSLPANDVVVATLSDSPTAIDSLPVEKSVRNGSPFRSPSDTSMWQRFRNFAVRFAPILSRSKPAAAVGSLALGLAGISFVSTPWFGLAIGVAGMAVGFWGLKSARTGVAIAGLILSCGAVSLAGYHGALKYFGSW